MVNALESANISTKDPALEPKHRHKHHILPTQLLRQISTSPHYHRKETTDSAPIALSTCNVRFCHVDNTTVAPHASHAAHVDVSEVCRLGEHKSWKGQTNWRRNETRRWQQRVTARIKAGVVLHEQRDTSEEFVL